MIDLSTWNLTLPVGEPARTIDTPELVAGYQDQFFQQDDQGLSFWAPVTGTTTKNASYPRTELRETFPDGTRRNWKLADADNYLRASLRVSKVPSNGKIVIGQIHNVEGSDPPIKLCYQYKADAKVGNLVAIYRNKPGIDTSSVTIFTGIALNQPFSYTIRLTPAGTLVVNVKTIGFDTSSWKAKLGAEWFAQTMYFKAGCYVQDNSGPETEGGLVTFDKLLVEHI